MSSPEVLRQWLVSVAPSYSPSGKVETIMLVSQEISREEVTCCTQAEAAEKVTRDFAVLL